MPPYTSLGNYELAHSTYQVPVEYHHAQPGCIDAKAASFAPEKTQVHPQAAYAIDPQLIISQNLGQSILSTTYGVNIQPTRPEQLHTPTMHVLLF